MPQLVANGPTIPVQLMNELDNGRVVFFCGAGISAGPGSELPSFAGLVRRVYDVNNEKPDEVEREALDLEDDNLDNLVGDNRKPNFDRAFGLLERSKRLGSQNLRKTIIECLSSPPTGPLIIHNALITLSQVEQGVRLITTNFDNRFVEAGLKESMVDASPKLPVPKPHSWSSLVHLHGRIENLKDGSNLVITAADFGRAYLTEAWASRFITELFRDFTVVFVGYSVSDPVMAYMVDALAVERDKGTQFTTAYTFAAYDGTNSNIQKVRDGWLAKNIEPILYDKRDDHKLFGETLIEWARIRNDPYQTRSQIALNEMFKLPSGPDDPVVERVAWALQDPVAAEALAEAPTVYDENEFPKIEKWLDMFDKSGLLCCVASDDYSNLDQTSSHVHLVGNGYDSWNPNNLDNTRIHLARWMSKHLHVPQLLAWVLNKGGQMHPDLRRQIQIRLADSNLEISSRLRFFWTILLDSKLFDRWRHIWTTDHYNGAESESERRRIEEQAIESIAPRLVVKSGLSSLLTFSQYIDETSGNISPIDACAHVKLTAGERETRDQLQIVLGDAGVLSRYAEALTVYLDSALSLATYDDDISEDSTLYRPSIAPHDQNHEHEEWTHLIDIARESYFKLADSDRSRADNLLHRWSLSKQPLFKRLALHALTDNPKSDISLAQKLLVAGRWPGMWNVEMRREVLRFLRLAGSRLPRELRVSVVQAIHKVPRTKLSKRYPDFIKKEKALRLYKLTLSGAKLDKKSMALVSDGHISTDGDLDERDEFLIWSGEGAIIEEEEFTLQSFLKRSITDISAELKNSNISKERFHELARQQPDKAASALSLLANEHEWPKKYWKGFLWALDEQKVRHAQSDIFLDNVTRLLSSAPDVFFAYDNSPIASFVKILAEEWGIDREADISILWGKTWNGIESFNIEKTHVDDVLNKSLNHTAGKLSEIALIRLSKYGPKLNTGIPASVRHYFDKIITAPNGHLGRAMLAMRLYHLFAIDRDWVRGEMIPLLDLMNSEEAANLWSGYAYSPNISPDLLQDFKEPFLEILKNIDQVGRRKMNLIGLFITICLEVPHGLTDQEVNDVIREMSDENLVSVLRSLENRFKGEPTERAQVWLDKVNPWLNDFWPRIKSRNTSKTSKAMLGILIQSGNAFPDAVDWSLSYLKHIDGSGLYEFKGKAPLKQHPEAMLKLLYKVVNPNGIPIHYRSTLKSILDELKEGKDSFMKELQFRKLYRIATQ